MVTNNLDLIEDIQKKQRLRSREIGCTGLDHRLYALSQLKRLLAEHESEWLLVLKKDLGKSAVEAYASEIGVLLNEIEYVEKNLSDWLKPLTKRRFLLSGKDKVVTSYYPYGSVLVLAPWNYPLQLALMPVIGTLAGGNGVVLKPSEFAPATSKLLLELVSVYFPKKVFHVVEGDSKVAESLTRLQWDFIFFTGSPEIGTKVYKAAASHLTPVLLELGGKNPCILDESGVNDAAVRKIAWGKFLNAGQSCIAPDTVYVPRGQLDLFLGKMKTQIQAFYGEDPQHSPDYGRIIHAGHFQKVLRYLTDGKIYYGGDYSEENRYIAPTLLVDVKPGSDVTKDEIFGPILPVIPYDSLDDLQVELNQLPVPLCVYVFSSGKETMQKIERGLESGSFSINEVIMHAVNPFAAFGGKGKSGMGRYHGEAGFQAFTYPRAVYSKKDPLNLSKQFPPYSKSALQALRKLRKKIF